MHRLRVSRHRDTQHLGQCLDGVDKAQIVEIHQKADGGAVGAATKAMIEILLGTDGEGRCFLVVERARRLEFAAGLGQRDAPADQLHDVGPRDQLIDEGLGDTPAHGSA